MAVNKAKSGNIDADKEVNVLRIGCRFKSGLLTERLIQPGESVFIGPHTFNTFCLDEDFPTDKFGERYTLFESKGSSYFLLFNDLTEGDLKRLPGYEKPVSLKTLISDGVATRKGKGYILPLSDKVVGRIKIGGYSFIFQFIAVPAVAVKSMAQYKPKYFTDDYYVFFSFLGLFGMMAITALIWVANQERPVLLKKEEVQTLMAEYLDVEPEEPKEPEEPLEEKIIEEPTEADPNNQVQRQKSTEQTAKPKETKSTPEKQAQKAQASSNMSASEEAAADAAVSNSFLFQQLGTTGNGNGMMIASAFGDGSGEGADLDQVLNGVSDGREAVTSGEMSVRGNIDKSGIGSAKINVEGANSKSGKSSAGVAPKVVAPNPPQRSKRSTQRWGNVLTE